MAQPRPRAGRGGMLAYGGKAPREKSTGGSAMSVHWGHDQERARVVEAVGVLLRAGVMSRTGHINVSCRVADERMVLTARGRAHEVDVDGFGLVGFDGTVVAGGVEPSTQAIVGMHTAVYRERSDVQAVAHTHSPHVTAFALAGRALPCRYEALVRRGQRTAVPVVSWAPRGSEALAEGIADAVRAEPDTQAVLLGNHGLLAFGASPTEVAKLVVVLEEAAEGELRAAALGGAKDLPPQALDERPSAANPHR